MATTNFSNLNTNQLTAWSKDIWKTARQHSFVMGLSGSGPNSMVQRITELKASEKGAKAIITLVPDLTGDGVVGDYELEDNEEAMTAYDQTIRLDQLRNGTRLAGKMADQKVVVRFREEARDVLGYWLADRIDQLFFLIASGWDLRMHTNGALRTGFTHNGTAYSRTATTGYALYDLDFRQDITAPSAKRYFRWNGTSSALVAADDFADLTTADTPSYKMLVELKAYAKDRRIRSLKGGAGMELYHVFLHPKAMAKLKLDSDFLANIRNAGVRGNSNPLFNGAVVTVDGLVLHENTHVLNTLGATAGTSTNVGDPGYKWGPNADVDGCRILLMGAQAMAFADLGGPTWEEDSWDYGNQNGISTGKILGLKKPVWHSTKDGTSEDYGIIAVDVAI